MVSDPTPRQQSLETGELCGSVSSLVNYPAGLSTVVILADLLSHPTRISPSAWPGELTAGSGSSLETVV